MNLPQIYAIGGVALALVTFQVGTAASDKPQAEPNSNSAAAVYTKECGGCHLAYPARLLPRLSWQGVMDGLGDHFGDNAEVDAPVKAQLLAYLTEKARTRSSKHESPAKTSPLRITEMGYFRHEHDKIPAKIRKDPKVGSLSKCETCHQDANDGHFKEKNIKIPGYGNWED